jgi:hypothetical protein
MVRIVLAAWESAGAAVDRTRRWERNRWKRNRIMNFLWAVAVVFFVLWILGFAAFHVTSGLIHMLLLLALIAIVVRLVTGRRTA